MRQLGAVTWSPDSRYTAIELSRPGRALAGAPSGEIGLIDVKARAMTIASSSAAAYLGFFNATWSPGGRRLAFPSVDANAVVRVWIWRPGTPAVNIRNLDVHADSLSSPVVWLDDDKLAIAAWEPGREEIRWLLFTDSQGNKNAAEEWKHAVDGKPAAVSILFDSGGTDQSS